MTFIDTGSLRTLPPAGTVTLGEPLNSTGRLAPADSAAPRARCPSDAFPTASGPVPYVLSRRIRTASPGIVTLAIIRTVALLTVVIPSVCCELPQAVTHFADADPRCCATRAEPAYAAMSAAIGAMIWSSGAGLVGGLLSVICGG